MSKRFFVDCPIRGEDVELAGAEAQHLINVMRAKAGDRVTLFDGSGLEFPASVTRITPRTVELEVLARQAVDRELSFSLILGVALPKGDRQRWLIEKAVEVGVTRIVPLRTVRGVVQPGDRTLGRLRRTVVEASKQCGRNRLMEIEKPQSVAEFSAQAPADAIRMLAHPTPTAVPFASAFSGKALRYVWLAIGPEGGFTEDELADLCDGWQIVSLGPRTLRIETSAIALAAAFSLLGAARD
jgi:16S rRNA (uracil1498-N3)-methyltransferase